MVAITLVKTKAILTILVAISLTSLQFSSLSHRIPRTQRESKLRERLKLYHITPHLSQLEFARAFRIPRKAFSNLLQLLYPKLNRDESQGASSSAGVPPPDKSLAITLRVLSGGSYHDIPMCFQVALCNLYAISHST